MKEAVYFETMEGKRVQCNLCPHGCVIPDGRRGICLVRLNRDGILYSEVFEKFSSIHLDPVEKKPLYHFFPGSSILSVGTKGCNMKCKFCQNNSISQCLPGDYPRMVNFPAKYLLELIQGYNNCVGVAYTYNEPTVFFESMLQMAQTTHQNGLKNVMVTNGFINPEPLKELLEYVDAFNVDLKAFNGIFYKRYTHSRLKPVLESIKQIRQSGKHLEITCLIIPGLNSDEKEFEEMVRWIANESGKDTVLHISRYFPAYQVSIDPTPMDILVKFHEIAQKYLYYSYLGNVSSRVGADTYCKGCGRELIRRFQYNIQIMDMEAGRCKYCNNQVIAADYFA